MLRGLQGNLFGIYREEQFLIKESLRVNQTKKESFSDGFNLA